MDGIINLNWSVLVLVINGNGRTSDLNWFPKYICLPTIYRIFWKIPDDGQKLGMREFLGLSTVAVL